MKGLWLRVRRLLGWRTAERDIDEELRFHVDMETEDLVRQGLDPTEARRRALVSFGGEDRWREETRGSRGTGWLEDGWRDLRIAARALSRAPGFAIAAIGTITLGVGATTTIFSIVHGVVLAPLPYADADRLVTVWMRNPSQNIEEDITSWPNFIDWREQGTSFEQMTSVRTARFALTGEADPEELLGATVSRGFFEMIGVPLAYGRAFRDAEVEGDPVQAVVIGYDLFTRRFGSDPGVVGSTILLDAVPHEVIGVAAPEAGYPRDVEVWAPQSFTEAMAGLREARGALWLPVVGRLREGVDLTTAQAEMDAVARRLEEAYPVVNEGVGITLEPLRETLVGDVRTPLLVLLGAVALVLLIAVVNVANLLLARGSGRARELAVRLTLGAGRGRIVRQVLAESALLGIVGALAGTALSFVAVGVLPSVGPVGLPRLEDVRVDGLVLGFALLTALGASLFFGVVPALQASRVAPGSHLRDGTRGSTGSGLARMRGAFVVAQFGLALLLLVGAGLLTRSFLNLQAVEPGFEPTGVLGFTVALPPGRYEPGEPRRAFFDELHEQLRAIPGVTDVGSVTTLFLAALPNMGRVTVESRPEVFERTAEFPVVQDAASRGFFAASGMEIVTGRGFDVTDAPDAAPVAVVNETFARTFLPGMDPLGQRFTWGSPEDEEPAWITIVGVVEDARRSGLDQTVRPSAFLPTSQNPPRRAEVLLRTSGDPIALTPAVRDVVRDLDGQLPLTGVRTLEQALSDELAARRFVTWLLGLFAATALLLAAVGIFGVMAYVVGQRTREIGIRVALGAGRASVLTSTLREGMVHAGIGLLLGAVLSMGATRFMQSQLFELQPTDPTTFIAAVVLLLGVAAVACLVPARRAAGVDPMVALREE